MKKQTSWIFIAVAALLIAITFEWLNAHSLTSRYKDARLVRDSLVIDSLQTELGWYQNQWETITEYDTTGTEGHK